MRLGHYEKNRQQAEAQASQDVGVHLEHDILLRRANFSGPLVFAVHEALFSAPTACLLRRAHAGQSFERSTDHSQSPCVEGDGEVMPATVARAELRSYAEPTCELA